EVRRQIRQQPDDGKVGQPERPQSEEQQPERAEDMLRAPREPRQELHRQQIEKPADEPPHAVLALPEPPRAMVDFDLGHAKAPRMSENGNEPRQLAIKPDLGGDLAPKAFEPAVVVVKGHPRHPTDEQIEDAAGVDLMPRIQPPPFPAVDDVEPL